MFAQLTSEKLYNWLNIPRNLLYVQLSNEESILPIIDDTFLWFLLAKNTTV
jgi:hypothetical protein